MTPAFIYFRELMLNYNNKFTLDFSDEEFVQEVNFLKNLDYYTTSLNCNLVLKNHVNDQKNDNKDRKKLIEELSQKSRLLLENGTAYQNDIGWLTSATARYFNFSGFGVMYNFVIWPDIIDEYSYKYKFYYTVEQKLKIVKFIHHFLIIKEMDLNLKE